MASRRTTLTADSEDLAVLAAEARRRKTSLARLLEEAVAEKAARLRRAKRPKVGLFSGGGAGIAASMQADSEATATRPWRS